MNLNSKNPRMRAKTLLTLALTVMALVVVSGTARAQGPTGPASTCCPPVNGSLFVRGMFRHQGNAANDYNMALDLAGPPATTNSFFNGLQAYLAYLKTLCPQTVGLKADFFRGAVTAPPPTPPNSPAGQLVGGDASIPKSTYTFISPGSTLPLFNTALNAGMNNFAYSNNQWYRIRVRITGVNAKGQPVNCGFDANACARDDTFAFVYGTGRMSGSTYTN